MRMKQSLSAIILSLIASYAGASLVNVAASANGGTATAISEGSYSGTTHYAYLANDSDYQTDWCSQGSMPAWVKIEFDDVYLISKVAIQVNYHQQTFAISLSNNGTDWNQVVAPTLSSNIPAEIPTSASAGASYEVFNITPQNAKFIRADITTTTAPGSHIFQAIVSEVEAYTVPEPLTISLLAIGSIALIKKRY